jgi:hypothetical protein
MRGITLAVTAAVAAIVLTATSGAGATDVPLGGLTPDVQLLPGDQSADIYGVGGGKAFNFTGTVKFNLSAHEGPNGDFGHVSVTYYTLLGEQVVSYSTSVTCVNIHTFDFLGPFDRGVVRGVIDRITPVPNILGLTTGDTVDFGIKDGGNPSSGAVDDFFPPSSQGVPATASCKTFTYTGNLNNVTQGNVNIKGP